VDAAREALRTGVREGRAFSTAVVEVVAQQLATAEADLLAIVSTAFEHAPHHAEVAVSAAAAAKEVATFVAFLREEVAPSSGARDVVALGEREYERRLSDWWGLSGIESLQQGAEAELADARTQMTELAAQLATTIPGAPASVRSFGDATATVMALLKPTAASADGIIPLYQAAIARAQDFCRERGTFTIPDPCQCEVRPSPELWRKLAAMPPELVRSCSIQRCIRSPTFNRSRCTRPCRGISCKAGPGNCALVRALRRCGCFRFPTNVACCATLGSRS
jgi:hypothetical protein